MTEEQTQPLKLSYRPDDLVRTNSIVSLSSSGVSESESTIVPDVAFVPSTSKGSTSTIDSPRNNRESQPLLGRMETDIVQFNTFPGIKVNE